MSSSFGLFSKKFYLIIWFRMGHESFIMETLIIIDFGIAKIILLGGIEDVLETPVYNVG